MITVEDGEFIPEKELDFNFKIPKRRNDSEENSNQMQTQVLDNSYYSIGEQQLYVARPPPAPKKESPSRLLKETIPDCDDDTLPRELTSMFQPLYCKLCAAQLSSNIVAKLHYKSKSHEKKIRKFLTDYSTRTGEPLHKRAKLMTNCKQDEDNPLYFHCDVCDLPLTGKLHAESHYMGKNHRKAVLGQKTPAGKGSFNEDGKWVRQQSTKKLANGQDNFGLDFHNDADQSVDDASRKEATPFRCDICNVTTTCREQLESHYNGQKHQKKLRQQKDTIIAGGQGGTPADNILTSVLGNCSETRDFSAYRTPSGQYYCQTCNLSLNSEIQFKQHLQSKNHLKKFKTT